MFMSKQDDDSLVYIVLLLTMDWETAQCVLIPMHPCVHIINLISNIRLIVVTLAILLAPLRDQELSTFSVLIMFFRVRTGVVRSVTLANLSYLETLKVLDLV